MFNRKFMTENARITDAYAQMYAKRRVSESSDGENGNLLRSLRGQLPIDGTGSAKTGSKLGVRKVLPFEKRDAKNCCGHAAPMKSTYGYGRVKTGPVDTRKIEHTVPSSTGSKLGVRKVLPFEKRDDRPTSIGRISNVKNVSVVKGVRESIDDFEDIEDTETISCEGCDKRDEVLDLVLSTFEQIYDNLSDDDKETVDEVKVEIESILNPDDEEDEEDEEDDGDFEEEEVGESVVNEVGPARPTAKPPAGKPPAGKPPAGKPPAGKPPKKGGKGKTGGKGEKGGKTGNSAWNSIEDLPREPGMTDVEYSIRNQAHKIREYAAKNKITLSAAAIALGLGAGALVACGLSDGDAEQPVNKDGDKNPLDSENRKATGAKDATEEDGKSGVGRNVGKPGLDDEFGIGVRDIDKMSPEMQAKLREELNDRLEYQRWKAQRGGGGSDGRGVIDQIADAPGRLIGGLGTGVGNAVSGLVGGVTNGVENIAGMPTRIYRDSARNIRGADYGIDADSAREERRLAAQREHEREMMKMKREEEMARWENEQKRQRQSSPSQNQTYTVTDNQGGENKVVQTPNSVTVTGPNWKDKADNAETK